MTQDVRRGGAPDRSTGRTTRALAEARGAVRAGRNVVFAVSNQGMAQYVRALADQWDWDEVSRHELKLGGVRLRIVAAIDLEMRLRGTRDLLLLDHTLGDVPKNLRRWTGPIDIQ